MKTWRLNPILLLVVGAMTIAASAEDRFYFVQITDTHWGSREGLALTSRAVAAINEIPLKFEFIVHTGDVTADAIADSNVVAKGLAIMKRLPAPVYYVPGNHDILRGDASETAQLFKRHFGPVSQRVDVGGVVCLFFYSEPLTSDHRIKGYDAKEWLDGNLKAAGRKPVLLFQHIPAVYDVRGQAGENAWADSYGPAWLRFFERNPQVKAVIAGHFHRDELHWVGTTPVYVASSIADFWGRQASFRVYEYRDGRLGYWTVYL